MHDFIVDRDRCIRDGLCVFACGRRALADDGEGGPLARDMDLCNACGHCSAVCPVGAVISPKCGGERATPLPDAPDTGFTGGARFLLFCRSIRRFKEESVAEQEILDILDIARKAPSASNTQPVSWLVLNDREKARSFSDLTMDWFATAVRKDPVLSSRYRVDDMLARHKNGDDPILRGAPAAVFALTAKDAAWGPVDASIAVTYFCLAAHAANIGSCWCGFGIRALEKYAPLREFIGIGDDVAVQGMAFFGYPAISYAAVPPRKPLRLKWL